MWPWLFQDRTGGPGVSIPSPAPTPILPSPEGLLGPLYPAFSLSIHSRWILNWGPFPQATRPEWPPGTWEAAVLDLQCLSSRQEGHRAPLGAPVSTVRETVLCVLDISPPSPCIQLSRTRIFTVGTSLNSHALQSPGLLKCRRLSASLQGPASSWRPGQVLIGLIAILIPPAGSQTLSI